MTTTTTTPQNSQQQLPSKEHCLLTHPSAPAASSSSSSSSSSSAKLRFLTDSTLATAAELVRCRAQGIPHSNQSRVLVKNIALLKEGLKVLENELSEAEVSGNVSSADLKTREDIFVELSKKVDRIENLTRSNDESSAGSTRSIKDDSTSDPKLSKFVRFAPLPDSRSPTSFSAAAAPFEVASAMESGQIVQLQQRMLTDQDVHLDQLGSSIRRQREMGLLMNDELETHAGLLESIDRTVERTDDRLNRARRRLSGVSKKARENGSLCLILTLTMILILLIIL